MKKIKSLFLVLLLFLLVGCASSRTQQGEETHSVVVHTSEPGSKNEILDKSVMYFDFSILSELTKVPDWHNESSKKDYSDAMSRIPEDILKEYKRKVSQNDIKLGEMMHIIIDDPTEILASVWYSEEEEQYIMNRAWFQEQGHLVVEIFIDKDRTVKKKVYSENGLVDSSTFSVDFSFPYTLLFTSQNRDCSVVYDEDENEMFCMRYHKEGNRVSVTDEDIQDFLNVVNGSTTTNRYTHLAYENKKNELVFPIMVNQEFHLFKVPLDEEITSYFYDAKKGSEIGIIRNNSIFFLKNIEFAEYIGYCQVSYVNEIELQKTKLDVSTLSNIEIEQWDGKMTSISASYEELIIMGIYNANYNISDMIEDGLFSQYCTSGNGVQTELIEEELGISFAKGKFYKCPTWREAEEIIKESLK